MSGAFLRGRGRSAPQVDRRASRASRRRAEEHAAAASRQAVLDEAFWRSVLAGVIVTAVGRLILRAIR